jgi:nicotinate-nucleotide pyrophosphorylase (carboxylating)
VRAGGGANHRFGLDDAVLIKDNHVALAGGVGRRSSGCAHAVGHLVKVEVEVDTLEQLDEALAAGVDAVLLDNMTPDELRRGGRRVSPAARSPRPRAASPRRPPRGSPPPAST